MDAYSQARIRLSGDISFHPSGSHFKVTDGVIWVTDSSSFQTRLTGEKRSFFTDGTGTVTRETIERF